MGFNYGKRRGRMEPLYGINDITAYSLGTRKLKYSHIDEDVFFEKINRQLDDVEQRYQDSI